MAAASRHFQILFRAALGFAALLLLPFWPARGQEPPKPCFAAPVSITITEIAAHGDVVLGSGQRLRLADIALPETGQWRQSALDALKAKTGGQAAASLDAGPDRWNLQRAAITLDGDDIADRLITRGLAMVNPGEAASLCNPALLTAERQARKSRIGLWADGANQPVPARNSEALTQRAGRFTLVEGRIVSVGVRRKWTYLNFGRDWQKDFTATISSTIWTRMQQSGLTADALKGKRVLIRGVIRQWNGPSLEIRTPEMLEVLDNVPDRT